MLFLLFLLPPPLLVIFLLLRDRRRNQKEWNHKIRIQGLEWDGRICPRCDSPIDVTDHYCAYCGKYNRKFSNVEFTKRFPMYRQRGACRKSHNDQFELMLEYTRNKVVYPIPTKCSHCGIDLITESHTKA